MPVIQTTDTFQFVDIFFVNGNLKRIQATLTDGTEYRLSLGVGRYPAAGSDDLQSIQNLQTIYAGDGFKDDMDNDVDVRLLGPPISAITIDNIEEQGLYNPFKAGSREGWLMIRSFWKQFIQGGLDIEEGDDTRTELRHKIGIVPVRGQPPGQTYNYSMRNWVFVQENSSRFKATIYFSEAENLDTEEDVNNHPEIKVMLAWLNDIRSTSASPVGDDIFENGDLSGRNFTEGNTVDFQYRTTGKSLHNSLYTSISIGFQRNTFSALSAIDIEQLTSLMSARTYPLVSSEIELSPVIGAFDAVLRLMGLEFNGATVNWIDNSFQVQGNNPYTNRNFILPLASSYAMAVEFNDLDPFQIGMSAKRFPTHNQFNVIHVTGTADTVNVIRLEGPEAYIESTGVTRFFRIHNVSQGRLDVQNADGDRIFSVFPGEVSLIYLTITDDGDYEIHVSLESRKIIINQGAVGSVGDMPKFNDSVNGLVHSLFPNVSPDFTSTDQFRRGTDAAITGGPYTFPGNLGTVDFPRSFVVNRTGQGFLAIYVGMNIDEGSSGVLRGSRINLWRLSSGSSVPLLIESSGIKNVSGSEDFAPYLIFLARTFNEGDRYFWTFTYEDDTNLSLAEAHYATYNVFWSIDPIINVEL